MFVWIIHNKWLRLLCFFNLNLYVFLLYLSSLFWLLLHIVLLRSAIMNKVRDDDDGDTWWLAAINVTSVTLPERDVKIRSYGKWCMLIVTKQMFCYCCCTSHSQQARACPKVWRHHTWRRNDCVNIHHVAFRQILRWKTGFTRWVGTICLNMIFFRGQSPGECLQYRGLYLVTIFCADGCPSCCTTWHQFHTNFIKILSKNVGAKAVKRIVWYETTWAKQISW